MASAPLATPTLPRPRARRVVRVGRRQAAAMWLTAFCLLLAGAGYLIARETSLFAVQSFTVEGAPADLERLVVAALARFDGESLVAISTDDVDRAVEAIPAVRSAAVDRDFPNTLRIAVRPERALAVVRRDADAWLVAASGRVLRQLEPGILRALPRVWIPSGTGAIEPGDVLLDDQGRTAVRALASLPSAFPLQVDSALGTGESLTIVLEGKTELRLGEPVAIRDKLEAAAAVIERLGRAGAREFAYLDVSVPTRPVGARKSQVVTSG